MTREDWITGHHRSTSNTGPSLSRPGDVTDLPNTIKKITHRIRHNKMTKEYAPNERTGGKIIEKELNKTGK